MNQTRMDKWVADILVAGSIVREAVGEPLAGEYITHALLCLAEAHVRELTAPKAKTPDMSGQDGYL